MALFSGLGGVLGFNKQIGGVNFGINIPFGDQRGNKSRIGDGGKTPQNNINRIIGQVSEGGGFSKPALYRIQITPPAGMSDWTNQEQQHIYFNCDSITIPGRNITTKPNKTYGLKKEYAYDKIHPEIIATFYVSESLEEFHFFEAWTDLMYTSNGNIGWYDDYAKDCTMKIQQLSNKEGFAEGGADLGVIATSTLYEVYPKILSPLRLSYAATNQVQKIDVTFTFRDTETEYPLSGKTAKDTLRPLKKKSSLFKINGINIPLGGGVSIRSLPDRNRSIF